MPDFLERAIRHSYKNSNLSKDEIDRRVYGHMNNIGAMNGSKITDKGREMETKHAASAAAKIPRR